MAAPATWEFLSSVTIDSTNNGIAANDGAGVTAAITAGTYWVLDDGSANDLLQAIEDALNAVGTGTWTVDLNSNKPRFSCDTGGSAWSISWNAAGTTVDTTRLGISDTSAAFGAADDTAVTVNYVHGWGWRSTYGPTFDSGRILQHDANQRPAPSGKVWTYTPDSGRGVRRVRFELEPGKAAISDGTNINADWTQFLTTVVNNDELLKVRDTASTSFTCTLAAEDIAEFNPQRLHPGLDDWSWDIRMINVGVSS